MGVFRTVAEKSVRDLPTFMNPGLNNEFYEIG